MTKRISEQRIELLESEGGYGSSHGFIKDIVVGSDGIVEVYINDLVFYVRPTSPDRGATALQNMIVQASLMNREIEFSYALDDQEIVYSRVWN